MRKIPRELCDLAKSKIKDLRQCGCVLTDADIVHINAISHDVNNPHTRQQLARGMPVRVGGTYLWPYTINSQCWFGDVGCNMPNATAALAYALAHGSSRDLWLADWQKVKRWYKKLTCTEEQLLQAIVEVCGQDEKDEIPPDENSNNSGSIALLAMMMHNRHGGTVDDWEMYVSTGYIMDMADLIEAQSKEQGGLIELLSARSNLALHYFCREIKKREGVINEKTN